MNGIQNKKIAVFGICKSGTYISILLKKHGNSVYLSDISDKNIEEYGNILTEAGIDYETGNHNLEKIKKCDIAVVSPGIPESAEIMKFLRKTGMPVIGEIEAAYGYINKPVIAITGSNGKTTTTSLIGKLLNDLGYKALVCGNIGYSLSAALIDNLLYDYVVIETSSFQLDTIKNFKPFISIITNITPNHLDRYSSFDEYALSKKNIFMNQVNSDYAVLNAKDEATRKITGDILPEKIYFNCEDGLFCEHGFIKYKKNNIVEDIVNCGELQIFGSHNYENVMTAVAAVSIIDFNIPKIRESLKNFKGVEHRMEFIREINGIRFYNDSKATSVDSVLKSLGAFNCGIVWIAGGRDKNSDYTRLTGLIRDRVKFAVLTGEAAEKIYNQLSLPEISVIEKDFNAAVETAYSKAVRGDVVILSPACTSYDRFSNFEERGRYFKKLVGSLK